MPKFVLLLLVTFKNLLMLTLFNLSMNLALINIIAPFITYFKTSSASSCLPMIKLKSTVPDFSRAILISKYQGGL